MATIYNHPYYPGHLEALGYGKDADWLEFEVRVPAQVPERRSGGTDRHAEAGGSCVAAKNAREIRPYARELFAGAEPGLRPPLRLVPLSTEQIDTYVKQYFSFIQPDFTKILLDANGRVAVLSSPCPRYPGPCRSAGAAVSLRLPPPAGSHAQAQDLDLYLGAVRPDLQNKGPTPW